MTSFNVCPLGAAVIHGDNGTDRKSCANSVDPDQTPQNAARRLIRFYAVCHLSSNFRDISNR